MSGVLKFHFPVCAAQLMTLKKQAVAAHRHTACFWQLDRPLRAMALLSSDKRCYFPLEGRSAPWRD